jgi:predicted transglutaminase-like cysteine proteinase
MRSISVTLLCSIVAGGLVSNDAAAGSRPPRDPAVPISLVQTSPSLAPFQHVRFCLRYPDDCRSNLAEDERIDLTSERSELLDSVNRRVNGDIAPVQKSPGQETWTIAPFTGDCNDYAVTKRHALLQSGLPAKALRLAVVRMKSGSGHLVLLAATTRGELVLDSLTDAIVPWQGTDYRWMKIQSASDPRIWHEVRVSAPSVPSPDRRLRPATRRSSMVSAPVLPF